MAQDSCLIELTLMFIVAALKVLDGVRGMGRGSSSPVKPFSQLNVL